ncbi:hypothetical protein E2I00_010229 [Balaenoptera physalus]|uniref:Uncharacterized protein n=1 Tax=Balaenoptera physalus TaxID=9770 RepID=A0A643BYQ1_BALPH|nr:hypothetical protein E2I00_010229 [Balaenoptera physalus]
MYGMEGLFPYSPALSQALMGLSPGSLLQQYQQYQQSLQEAIQQQQQRQLQQQKVQQPKASQTPVPQGAASPDKDPAKESPRPEEQKNAPRNFEDCECRFHLVTFRASSPVLKPLIDFAKRLEHSKI